MAKGVEPGGTGGSDYSGGSGSTDYGDEQVSSPWSASTILHATPVGPALVVARRRRRRAAAEQAWRYRIFGEAAADSARVHIVVVEEDLLHAEEEMAEAAARANNASEAV